MNWTIARGGPECRHRADAVVISDRKYFDAEFFGLVNNCLCVFNLIANLIATGRLPTKVARVIMRVNLQRTLVETRSSGRSRIVNQISCVSHSPDAPIRLRCERNDPQLHSRMHIAPTAYISFS